MNLYTYFLFSRCCKVRDGELSRPRCQARLALVDIAAVSLLCLVTAGLSAWAFTGARGPVGPRALGDVGARRDASPVLPRGAGAARHGVESLLSRHAPRTSLAPLCLLALACAGRGVKKSAKRHPVAWRPGFHRLLRWSVSPPLLPRKCRALASQRRWPHPTQHVTHMAVRSRENASWRK